MDLFNQRVAALTWSKEGLCLGVLLSQHGSKYKVVKFFKEQASSPDAISSTLERAHIELELKDSDLILAGESGLRSTLFDLILPQMKAADLMHSLQFSLSNHLPIDLSELNWAYRVLSQDKTSQQHIRIVALKKQVWNEWLDHIGSLKVDLLAPPSLVFDSIIDEPVYIADTTESGFLLNRDDEDKLQIQNIDSNEVDFDCFGLGEQALANDKIELNELASLSAEDQQIFAESLLLALHGFSTNLKSDRNTSLKVPINSRPKRHTLSKNIVLLASIYLIMLGVFSLTNYLTKKHKDLNHIKLQTKQLQAQTLVVDQQFNEQLTLLKDEITQVIPEPISLLNVMNEITEALPHEFYLKDFRLNGRKIDLRILSSGASVASTSQLFDIFKNLDLFDDDVPISQRGSEVTVTLHIAQNKVVEAP